MPAPSERDDVASFDELVKTLLLQKIANSRGIPKLAFPNLGAAAVDGDYYA